MPEWLTEEEIERISDFANTPGYERTPEMLQPEEDDD